MQHLDNLIDQVPLKKQNFNYDLREFNKELLNQLIIQNEDLQIQELIQ